MDSPKESIDSVKEDTSADVPLSNPSVRSPEVTAEGLPRTLLEAVSGLREVRNEEYDEAQKWLDQLRNERRSASDEKKELFPLLDVQRKIIRLPENLQKEDHRLLGSAILTLAKKLGYTVWKYRGTEDLTLPSDDKHLLIGLFFGTDENIHINLDVTKKGIERGRALALALRVQGEFIANKKLGQQALLRNHYWFGNDPVGAKKANLHYFARVAIDRLSGKQKQLSMVVSILFSLFRELGLSGFPKEYAYRYVRPISDVVEDFKREVKAEIGRDKSQKKKTMLKAPEKPTQSPLFLREEMAVLSNVINPFWKRDKLSDKEYLSRMMDSSFDEVYRSLQETYNKRWEFLTVFASLTTQRLTELRRVVPLASNIRKRAVNRDLLVQLLVRRSHPEEDLLQEARKLLRTYSLDEGVLEGLKKEASRVYEEESFKYQRRLYLLQENEKRKLSNREAGKPAPKNRLMTREEYNQYYFLPENESEEDEWPEFQHSPLRERKNPPTDKKSEKENSEKSSKRDENPESKKNKEKEKREKDFPPLPSKK
jgi:hypothetical protein